MIHPLSNDTFSAHAGAYLAIHQLPSLTFTGKNLRFRSLRPIWRAMQAENPHQAIRLTQEELDKRTRISDEERAALYIGLAAADFATGACETAKKLAGKSLDLFPDQWSAHRIMLQVMGASHDYQAAYLQLSNIHQGPGPTWDEQLSKEDYHTALAGWAWRLGEWEQVARHLLLGFPYGIETMPEQIQEDWFRLALYRDRPEDAVAVATILIKQRPVSASDELLQTFVKNGWTAEALPLYRTAFHREPESQLLRRRLVALCIKEGELDEARKLTAPGALDLAA